VASVLGRRGHHVSVLASGETRGPAARLGFDVTVYRRTPDPDVTVAFEEQAESLMATMAGQAIALDAHDAIDVLRPNLVVVDCMLPAAIAAGRASGTPTASLVHFLYGPARKQMLRGGGSWTTDLRTLAATQRALGLAPARDGVAAWEAPELLVVGAPRWMDLADEFPPHVVHAGPLGVAGSSQRRGVDRGRVLVSFSTTVMHGQLALIERVCQALAGIDRDAVLTLGPAVDRQSVRVPERVEVVGFADHDRLMPGAGAVIGHGGLGTVLRALAHGVPQLLLPLGRDQAFNAGRVEQLGGGLALPASAAPEAIRAALDRLLKEPRFAAEAARLADRIAAEHPDRRAAEALECVARRR